MGQALYRKYRPKSLAEVIGQEHITQTLENALKSGQISHAYLFTGPRGAGKTSVARILAYRVNDFKYTNESNFLDIIEIDAASNRRIDEIRDLRDKINIAPSSGKYKVYIIDEVHMLTKEAFNALLKTLEEPPDHAIFILATTESHKVPDTIISRTQQFNFRPISVTKMAEQLKNVAKNEKISIDEDAINLISEYSEGSFRDGLGLLDQVSSNSKKVTEKDIENLLGLAPHKLIESLVRSIEDNSRGDLVSNLTSIYDEGYDINLVCNQLVDYIKSHLINQSLKIPEGRALELMSQLIESPSSSDPKTYLEIVLISTVLKDDEKREELEPPRSQQSAATAKSPSIELSVGDQIAPSSLKESEFMEKFWPLILTNLQSRHFTIYSVVKQSEADLKTDSINLTVAYDFHFKSLDDPKNKKVIKDSINEVMGGKYNVTIALDKSKKLGKPDKKTEGPSIDNISRIFGEAELMEQS